ncbi:MAG: RDD family protein [Gammaproteobacteria bacterium]|nr:RDD family protein [Gammaproteobacteria bacterium]
MTQNDPTQHAPGIIRRLLALSYDALLLAGVLMVAATPVVLMAGGQPQSPVAIALFRIYLLTVSFVFFGWSWVHGGQTVGMRAWRIRLTRRNGGVVDWWTAFMRFGLACATLGLGLLWAIFDNKHLAAYDRWTATQLTRVPKNSASTRPA